MHVIVEWNQASRRPSLVVAELYEDEADAVDDARIMTDRARDDGRGETYTVHELGGSIEVED